ncbi:MAG: 1-acyl-sn-glycerol-3-phosphate acyltransferase [Verrucomicrobia bacterium]|nr:1-acyl-sn-glycerol-3-phosphate acyltransferase [Verrucomicrobiota bacterium]
MTGLMVFLAKLISGANARWLGCVPDTRQRIYFANHTSNLDALVLWAVLPAEVRALTRPVAARDYWSTAIRRYIADKIFHAILIERKKPTARDNPIEQILAAMGNEKSIIIFPEGGRQTADEPVAFKSGLYHLARKRPDVELIPVLMDNLNRILPKGEVFPVPLIGHVTFGAPLKLLPEETKPAFLGRARAEVMRLHYL